MAIDIGPKIGIDGEKEFRKNLNHINDELRALGSEMRAVTSAFELGDDAQDNFSEQTRVLNRQIDLQEQKLKELRRGLEQSADKYGENDSKTLKWKRAVNDATTELNKMRSQLKKTEDEMSGLTDATDISAKSLGDLNGLLKKGLAVGVVVAGVKELADAVLGIEESTREYRSIMGSLEVSSQRAGYTSEQTEAAYKRLYGVLGDTQATATTVANLQAIGLTQGQLLTMIDAVTGAWSTYGDSIPIDGLAEAINETVKVGQVTGVFADALNWAGVSEDDFNRKLSLTNNETERTNLVMQELARMGLAEAGQAWRDVNKDIVDANEAQSELDAELGRLGGILAPLAADIIGFAADALGALIDGLKSAVEWFRSLNDESSKRISANMDIRVPKADGSHADGLGYVPFDGYMAQLHKGEMVLTAAQAETVRSGKSLAASIVPSLVNSLATLQSGNSIPDEVTLVLKSDDGQTMGRWLVPFVRSEDKSNPEVVSDPV